MNSCKGKVNFLSKVQIKLTVYRKLLQLHQFFKFIAFSIFTVLLSSSAFSQSNATSTLLATPWQELEGGRVRVALEPVQENGTFSGVIEVNLKPGWKTYWQNPGESGLAPSFDFQPPANYHISFPVPHFFKDGNDWSIGYKNSVLLPFVVDRTSDQSGLKGQLTIGICKEICLPLVVPFDFSDFDDKIALSNSLLTLAKDKLPENVPENTSLEAYDDGKLLTIIITGKEKTGITAIYLDGQKNEIGPAKLVKQSAEQTIFTAPIIAINSATPLTFFYTVEAKPVSFSGTLTSHKR